MADVRALLAAERNSRRISHPLLSYTKSGLLQCTACNLNIRSETLWEGHLKSANHKKNAAAALDPAPVSKKRKIEDDGEGVQDQDETRKKTKSVRFKGMPPDFFDEARNGNGAPEEMVSSVDEIVSEPASNEVVAESREEQNEVQLPPSDSEPDPAPPQPAPTVNEDEWAAFERDLAPLTRDPPPVNSDPSYTAAVISAPALSAADIAAQSQQPQSTRRDREAEAQDEKEESEARLQDEFAVMEEMEERVRRLREKREALRVRPVMVGDDMGAETDTGQDEEALMETGDREAEADDDDDDDEEVDEWFS